MPFLLKSYLLGEYVCDVIGDVVGGENVGGDGIDDDLLRECIGDVVGGEIGENVDGVAEEIV